MSSRKKNFFQAFVDLAKLAEKDYANKNTDAPIIKKEIDNALFIVKKSEEAILDLKAQEETLDTEYRKILQILRSNNSSSDEKKKAYLKYENRLIEICRQYFTNRFFATAILIGSGKRSSVSQKNYTNPFDARIDKVFFTKKNSGGKRSDAMNIYSMLYSENMDVLGSMSSYALLYSDIWKIFIKEWDFHIGEITKYIDEEIIKSRKNKTPSDFVTLVNVAYPEFDSTFRTRGPAKHPMDAFMRCSSYENKANMLLELIKDKKSDPEGVSEYIKKIIAFEKKYAMRHPDYTTAYNKYYQIMYDLIAEEGSLSLFTLFDQVFSIKDNINEPWSPLTDRSSIREKHIQYLIEHNVNLNLEEGIIGLRLIQIPGFASLIGFKDKTQALDYFMSKGYVINDPTAMYFLCIDNHDIPMIKFLINKIGVQWEDNYPLRAALFYGNLRVCWMIYDAYGDDESIAEKEIEYLLKYKTIPDMKPVIESAKKMYLTIQETKKYAKKTKEKV